MNNAGHVKIAEEAFKRGIVKGWNGFLWLLKILLPVSLLSFVLNAGGWLAKADFLLTPVMDLLRLPAAAALPIIMGICTGIAGTVASMISIPFTDEQTTLIAIFSLISHNMIQEGIVQARSGLSFLPSVVTRLTASFVTVWVVGRLCFEKGGEAAVQAVEPVGRLPMERLILDWLGNTLGLTAVLFLIIISMLVILELMKAFRWMERLNRLARPIIRGMGLDPEVGILWLTTSFFGLAYGGTVIVQEVREQSFSPGMLQRLHISAGINHAVIEEPLLFLPLGIHPVMLWVPRLVVAALAVHLFNFTNILWDGLLPKSS